MKNKYVIMNTIDNTLFRWEDSTIDEARRKVKYVIDNSSQPLTLCIMRKYCNAIEDSNGVLIERIDVLNRAEDCCYTNFNGVGRTNVIIRKQL